MEKLVLEATDKTPAINLSPSEKIYRMSGKVMPKDPDDFFEPIFNWLENFMEDPVDQLTFEFDLFAFNISSSKRILFLLYKLDDLYKQGYQVKVKWYYKEEDDDMLEVGQDYSCMVKLPFVLEKYTSTPGDYNKTSSRATSLGAA